MPTSERSPLEPEDPPDVRHPGGATGPEGDQPLVVGQTHDSQASAGIEVPLGLVPGPSAVSGPPLGEPPLEPSSEPTAPPLWPLASMPRRAWQAPLEDHTEGARKHARPEPGVCGDPTRLPSCPRAASPAAPKTPSTAPAPSTSPAPTADLAAERPTARRWPCPSHCLGRSSTQRRSGRVGRKRHPLAATIRYCDKPYSLFRSRTQWPWIDWAGSSTTTTRKTLGVVAASRTCKKRPVGCRYTFSTCRPVKSCPCRSLAGMAST